MLTTNQGYSSYNALQLQFRRRLSRGLQALVSYTWSHSLDVSSSDSNNSGVPFGLYKPQQDYGNSDFDVRHAARAAFTYDLPGNTISNPVARGLISNWAIDGMIQAQTATPFSVLYTPNSQYASYLQGPVTLRPDQVPGHPIYLRDSTAPGGKRLNPVAFSIPIVIGQGTEGRNSIRAFNLFQTDLSLRRQFHIREHWVLLFRGDAFNIFNHPNFGPPSPYIDQGGFGLASATLAQSLGSGGSSGFNPLYQVGGPRSIQVSAKLQF
jgi:hypothetical protein